MTVPLNIKESLNDSLQIKDGSSIDYEKIVEEKSKKLSEIKETNYIFISHACKGRNAYYDEEDFVRNLYEILTRDYKKKVYLDLIDNPEFTAISPINAAKSSIYGVFICSPRFIENARGNRIEKYKFDYIQQEINIFLEKDTMYGKRIILIKFGVNDDVFKDKNPLMPRYYIKIEEEYKKNALQKASFVANEVIKKIKEFEKIKTKI